MTIQEQEAILLAKHSVIIFVKYEDGFIATYENVKISYTNEEEEMEAINKFLKKELKKAIMAWKYIYHVGEVGRGVRSTDKINYVRGIMAKLKKENH